jgi:polyisoprenoid-binding protein YceI
MKSLFTTLLIFLFTISGNVLAQSDSYEILDKSTLKVTGTSTLHDWEANAETINSYIDFDIAALEGDTISNPVNSLSLTIPVEDLKSGKDKMDKNMYEALKKDDFPNIMFKLNDAELVNTDSTLTSMEMDVTGNLTIAGTSNVITLPVTGNKLEDGSFKFTGSYEMNMKDFDVDPPSVMFGTIKSGEMVTISFEMYVGQS